jgi:hypothetical protein
LSGRVEVLACGLDESSSGAPQMPRALIALRGPRGAIVRLELTHARSHKCVGRGVGVHAADGESTRPVSLEATRVRRRPGRHVLCVYLAGALVARQEVELP